MTAKWIRFAWTLAAWLVAAEGAAQAVYLSPLYLQRGFKLVTGYSMGEYVRDRRLYLAGLEVIAGRER